MKRLFLTITIAFLSLQLWANVPAGGTVYIDCSQHWCCAPCYLLYSSNTGWTYVMQPVPGYSGVYSYTSTSGIAQPNIRLCKGKQVVTADFSGWPGSYISSSIEMTNASTWTSSKPYYIVTGEDGSGYWAAAPVSSGATALSKVEAVSTGMNCIDSTYSVTIRVYYEGAPCALKLTGSDFGTGKTITVLGTSPYEYELKGLSEPEGVNHSVTATLYSNSAATAEVGHAMASWTSPVRECTEDHGVTTVCEGDMVTLTAAMEGEKYEWSTGATTRSITVPVTAKADYWVRTLSSTITIKNNLMANGDFESNPPSGFESDYVYAGWDPNPLFGVGGTHNDKSGLYIISSSALRSCENFADLYAHGGTYFCLVDGDKSGDAWRATTAINPALVVTKDSSYHFSFWAANINSLSQNGHPAQLQFRISLDGGATWANLGSPYTPPSPGSDPLWGYSEVIYKATATSNNVHIAVSDITNFYGVGNDFALDDIMFQQTTPGRLVEAKRDIYHVQPINCAHFRDTICAGDTYTGHGYNQTFDTPDDYELNTGDTVYLHVEQPVQATFTAPAAVCDFEGGALDVTYQVTGGNPTTYSLSFSDSRFAPVTDAALPSGKISVAVPAEVTSGVITVSVVLGGPEVRCPYEGTFELSLNAGIPMYAKWTDLIFVDNSDSLYVAYQWYCNGTAIPGANKQYLYDPAGLPGSYYVEVTQADGTRVRTCESTFADLQRSAELNPGDGQKPVYETRIYQMGANYRIVQTIYTDGTFSAEKQIIR